MTKLTPPHQTPPGASKNGSQRVSLGTFGQSQNGDSKLQGGRLSKLSSVVNTDFGRMKGTNRRIFLLKKNTCLCFRGSKMKLWRRCLPKNASFVLWIYFFVLFCLIYELFSSFLFTLAHDSVDYFSKNCGNHICFHFQDSTRAGIGRKKKPKEWNTRQPQQTDKTSDIPLTYTIIIFFYTLLILTCTRMKDLWHSFERSIPCEAENFPLWR